MFKQFLAQGLCVIPLRKGVPQVEWSRYYNAMPTEDEARGWDEAGHKEYALLCGEQSGVIGLDIDTDENTEFLYNLAGATPLRKRGSKGFTAFYKYNGEKSTAWRADGEAAPIVELLSDKRLTTIPPSPHRKTGEPYVWMSGEADWRSLPTLSPDFILFMDAKYPRPKPRQVKPIPAEYERRNVDLTQAAEMLDYISSDCPRDEWLKIGMALRDEFGDAACHLWHNWSQKAGKRYNHNDAQACWRSFNGGGVTIATIIYAAQRAGYVNASPPATVDFEIDLSYLFEKKRVDSPALKVHGLVGEIADWITNTAISPQPALSLAAAITFMGMVKGHRVKHKIQDARTNMLTLALAPTGGGKDYPQRAIDRLAVDCGLERHLMGRPTSGTAMLTGINKAGGVAMLSIDEMGRYISNITMKQSQGFQREIADYMIELFSAANRIFRGRQYADEKKNPQIVINHPHFCCMGSTVAERLRAACTSAEVIDGFLNRWLIFSSDTRPEKRFDRKSSAPPKELVDKIVYWLAEHPIEVDNYGTQGEPCDMEFTPEAWDVFLKFEAEIQKKLETTPHPMDGLYIRSVEHVIKLSMVICDEDFIGVRDIELAIAIVRQSKEQIILFADSITDNQHDADVVFVLDVIKKHGGAMSKNWLTQRTRRINQKLRNEILSQLIEAGDVVQEKSSTGAITYRCTVV